MAILIVEDDLTFSRILNAFLEKNGFDVKVAHSVKEATEVLAASPFDLALLITGCPMATDSNSCKK